MARRREKWGRRGKQAWRGVRREEKEEEGRGVVFDDHGNDVTIGLVSHTQERRLMAILEGERRGHDRWEQRSEAENRALLAVFEVIVDDPILE